MILGAFASSAGAGPIAKFLGRKSSIWVAALICVLSNVIMMTTTSIGAIYFARFLIGIANGMLMTFSQLYLQECSPAKYSRSCYWAVPVVDIDRKFGRNRHRQLYGEARGKESVHRITLDHLYRSRLLVSGVALHSGEPEMVPSSRQDREGAQVPQLASTVSRFCRWRGRSDHRSYRGGASLGQQRCYFRYVQKSRGPTTNTPCCRRRFFTSRKRRHVYDLYALLPAPHS